MHVLIELEEIIKHSDMLTMQFRDPCIIGVLLELVCRLWVEDAPGVVDQVAPREAMPLHVIVIARNCLLSVSHALRVIAGQIDQHQQFLIRAIGQAM